MKRIALICSCLVALLVLFTGCSTKTDAPRKDDSLKKVMDSGQFILGLDVGFPPMGFIDEKGEITGFDIDVAQEVCNRLGVKLVKKGINWDNKEDDLKAGTIDCIWNGFSMTPGRAETLTFSEPYMKNKLIFVVSENSDAKAMQDLAGRTIGVQSGATARELLEKSALASNISIVTFGDNLTLLQQLKEGNVDAALVDSVVAFYYMSSNEAPFFILPSSLSEENYAIGFRKGDKELRDRVQTIISELKTDGTLGKISKKWFGSDITTVK